MYRAVKQGIKKLLEDRQRGKYDKLLEKKTVTYDAWIRKREQERNRDKEEGERGSSLSVKLVPYQACGSFCFGRMLQTETADIILFADSCGTISEYAKEEVAEYFSSHSQIEMLYGDEDVLSPEGIRYTPWFKPDWSPDTFLSFFYFGSIFAVRTKTLQGLTAEEKQWILGKSGEEGWEEIYLMCYLLAKKCGGFERRQKAGEEEWGFPIGHVKEVLFHGRRNREWMLEQEPFLDFLENRKGYMDSVGNCKLSVIIPSKDHEEVLKRCIRSVAAEAGRGQGIDFEIIVVDNGSKADTRQEMERWLGAQGVAFTYLYQKMPFHFSKMCNMGAEVAEGEVLLFLNDDVELPDFADSGKENFLETIERMACLPYAGAVGTKLYYPDSVRIQHAGIVNLKLGPVHKLQFMEDTVSYYYGWNRRRHNVIAVTGACLGVEKDRFFEAGRFPEELPVAFNDVALCFSLFEKGYYNVVLQDYALYHYESLSRGDDGERDKLERLLRERDRLYQRHPCLYGEDPFYHKYLANDMLSTGFDLRADYELEYKSLYARAVEAGNLLAGAREDRCVIISLEYAGPGIFVDRAEGKDTEYFLQGYSFVAGSDNALFEKRILLKPEKDAEDNGGKLMVIRPEPLRRKDVEENLPDQTNVGLTGFGAVIDGTGLAKGSYRIGVLAKDTCSGQKLYCWTNRYLNTRMDDGNDRL